MQLEYPLLEDTHKNMILTQEKSVIAYYRIRSETVMLTDMEKKQKTKKKVARALKRLKNSEAFEINLLPVNADAINQDITDFRSFESENSFFDMRKERKINEMEEDG